MIVLKNIAVIYVEKKAVNNVPWLPVRCHSANTRLVI